MSDERAVLKNFTVDTKGDAERLQDRPSDDNNGQEATSCPRVSLVTRPDIMLQTAVSACIIF
ncbi:hypothetical protein EF773_16430 [Escherichia coli]|nr:hypothetical protein [Escherichia coli]